MAKRGTALVQITSTNPGYCSIGSCLCTTPMMALFCDQMLRKQEKGCCRCAGLEVRDSTHSIYFRLDWCSKGNVKAGTHLHPRLAGLQSRCNFERLSLVLNSATFCPQGISCSLLGPLLGCCHLAINDTCCEPHPRLSGRYGLHIMTGISCNCRSNYCALLQPCFGGGRDRHEGRMGIWCRALQGCWAPSSTLALRAGLRTRLSNKDVAFPSGQQLRRQSIPTAWAAL